MIDSGKKRDGEGLDEGEKRVPAVAGRSFFACFLDVKGVKVR